MTKGASWGQSAHWHTDTKIAWEAIVDGLPQPTQTLPEHVRRIDQRG